MDYREEAFYESLICPITQEIMENPVIAADGHCYEKNALIQWLAKGKETSPLTGVKLENTQYIENYHLKSMINIYKSKLNSLPNLNKSKNRIFS